MPRNRRAVAAPADVPFEGPIAASVSDAPASPPPSPPKKQKVQDDNEASSESMHYSMEGDSSSHSGRFLRGQEGDREDAVQVEDPAPG